MHALHPKSTRKVILKIYMRDSVYLIYTLANGRVAASLYRLGRVAPGLYRQWPQCGGAAT